MRKLFGMLFFMILSANSFAQEVPKPTAGQIAEEKRFEAGFDGMLAVSYGNETLGINVGGPSLKYKFTKSFKVGVGAFPSLIVADDKAYPRLAVSPSWNIRTGWPSLLTMATMQKTSRYGRSG